MLPRELVGSVTPVTPARAAEPAADPRQQAFAREVAPLLGQAIRGAVQARLTDGTFVVRFADTQARMQLPPGAQVGAEVPLTLVGLHPRPTFQVGAQATTAFAEAGPAPQDDADAPGAPLSYREGAAVGRAAGLGLLASSAALGAQAFAGGTEAKNTTLSPTAQALAGVLAAAQKADSQLSAIVGRAPLVGGPGADPAALAAGLQQAFGKSGLFYESHLAEWARGGRPLSELANEPQQQAAQNGARPNPQDPATAQFISMQLAAQEQSQLAWKGQLWPGQPMEWDVQREAHGDEGEGEQAIWHSRLRLRFPQLGELEARLRMVNGALQVSFAAADDDTAALLRQHAPQLAGALEVVGTPLAGFDARAAAAATGDGDA
ncbi:flagellar hook-length control protein FliK [Telluria beijingensis]|uniref:flagellar hook-length control protein FliK n=1 Tax=Telluria beijingensis TaxID=3068633 RepID=UPI0027956415|nr:flagellar hook-length control protein FliK [Massilia sp. REN29]